jgi:K+-transporting ATPase A subunit
MALTRGIPWLASLLSQWMPEGKAVPEYKRQLAAIGLTGQMFAGAALGIAAQAFLAWGLIFHVMPALGLDLLDMVRAVAALDLPMQLWPIVARIL